MELSGGAKLDAYLANISKRAPTPETLRVGFLEDATYDDGTPVAMVAAINNFGAPAKGIPPRPFFSNMIKEKSDGWGKTLGKALDYTGMDVTASLGLMGEKISGQLAQSIRETNAPPNSPVTNLLKQRFPMSGQTFADVMDARRDVAAGEDAPAGKPLVQTGNMLNSIGYDINGVKGG